MNLLLQRKPRPREDPWSFDLMLSCLLILTASFFLLTIYSILQANESLWPVKATAYLSFKILDASSAATLFVTLLGALLIRHQFAIGLLPHISYRSANATRTNPGNTAVSFETWRVDIRNSGLGAAIIINTKYVLEATGSKPISCIGKHQDILTELARLGLIYNSDYWLANNTAGFALSPKDDCLVFEIKAEHLQKIKRLDMMLYFQSQLGRKYLQNVLLVPHYPIQTLSAG